MKKIAFLKNFLLLIFLINFVDYVAAKNYSCHCARGCTIAADTLAECDVLCREYNGNTGDYTCHEICHPCQR